MEYYSVSGVGTGNIINNWQKINIKILKLINSIDMSGDQERLFMPMVQPDSKTTLDLPH